MVVILRIQIWIGLLLEYSIQTKEGIGKPIPSFVELIIKVELNFIF